jgi:hypothetical protein
MPELLDALDRIQRDYKSREMREIFATRGQVLQLSALDSIYDLLLVSSAHDQIARKCPMVFIIAGVWT